MLKLVRDKMKAMVGVVKLDDKAKVTQVVPETVTQEDLRDDVAYSCYIARTRNPHHCAAT